MDDPFQLTPGIPDSVTLAQLGYGIDEIVSRTGQDELTVIKQLAEHKCGIATDAHKTRVEQRLYQRILGTPADGDSAGLAPHFQAAQLYLATHNPSLYGRQVAGAGGVVLNITVDRRPARELREHPYIDGELLPTPTPLEVQK